MRLLIDIGNTNTKLAVFENNKMIAGYLENCIYKSRINEIINIYPDINLVFSSSSNKDVKLNRDFFDDFNINFIEFENNKYENIFSSYRGTLGEDRVALSIAAISLYNENALIIDLGTCITYDLILNGIHQGGQISPGLKSRLELLNSSTSSLPLLNFEIPEDFIGRSTKQCMMSGVYFGLLFEIDSMIKRYTYNNQLTVILTGGDLKYFKKSIKNVVFDDNLLMKGLNCILNENI